MSFLISLPGGAELILLSIIFIPLCIVYFILQLNKRKSRKNQAMYELMNLDDLKSKGQISEVDYQLMRKAILDKMA
jgi:cbb3-type cytochrome oxidase subunit 3